MRELWLVRHGETEWSRDGRHTSRTDLELTDVGERAAKELGKRLGTEHFDAVFSSPRRRALDTARLAGFADVAVVGDLVEWDYGAYEGVTTPTIRETVPGWTIWTHGAPGGETADEVTRRLDRALEILRALDGVGLVFGHSHALRALSARWIEEPVAAGRHFKLDTSTVSILGYDREEPVIVTWNS